MLSVLSTPWTNPATIQLAARSAIRSTSWCISWTAGSSRPGAFRRWHRARKLCQAIVDQLRHVIAFFQRQQPLEGADADVAMAQSRHHRRAGRAGFVAAGQRLAGLHHAEGLRSVDAERFEHFGGEDFAHRAFQRQPAVARARLHGVWPDPLVPDPKPVLAIAQLRVKEAAAVADLGIARGIGARDSAGPAARAVCYRVGRTGRNGAPTPRPSVRPIRRSPHAGRCGSAAAFAGSPPRRPDRQSSRPAKPGVSGR